jgi:hypothetical protein
MARFRRIPVIGGNPDNIVSGQQTHLDELN